MLDRTSTPLLDILRQVAQQDSAPFYVPGHKKGSGAPRELLRWWGGEVFRADLTELPQLDNLAAPEGAIAEAQALAAEVFGARRTWFLINGSTAGILAAILATCQTGDKIILPRTAHKSAISGLILSGAIPIFIHPTYDRDWDLPLGISPNAVAAALEAHPDAKAVMVVSPTYQGVCSDIASIADVTRQRDIPLIVDEAHGAHFTFHPDLPTPALEAGADVAIQSTHKVLGALTQASMLHLKGDRIDDLRLDRALQLVQSSSPSYLLMASLDGARQQMATKGHLLMSQTLQLAREARTRLSDIAPLSVLEVPVAQTPGFFDLDPTRLMVKVDRLGINGYDADEILDDRFGVTAELVERRYLAFAISLGNTATDIDRLVEGLRAIARESAPLHLDAGDDLLLEVPGEISHQDAFSPPAMSPRDAFFAPLETVSVSGSIGRLSGELICPYPPGIPVLMPGEEITPTAIEVLQRTRDLGGTITGCCDRNLQTIQVVST
ncbi:aminotransferase class I/II-fold pyridoxal phosphate-dependent enzyme [Oscillatoriales cyanobacterium LEGE 11467]|uniref:Aminotransferase class I/II-fold pyridoxal phosphate-dependent enzyme n=1 Tax=Zarconia navalis LEGE 11467 TaxID=1828826 RepID=A0A928Z894_9CYAN|nr:aminotransferase class I/II-fold pyridoxal phosphate-dependent enzyme [Zarconia navalis]MBE9040314.1 aminotransferase class I/II-fold pyridoxal phosphate-dependent enzyme [Zarconia navalis LEGE 11467]